MQRLLEALARVTPSNSPQSTAQLAELIKTVHRAYLQQALGAGDATALPAAALAALRRLALYLEAATLLRPLPPDQLLQDSLYVAATVFEFLGQYQRSKRTADDSPAYLSHRLAQGDLADSLRAAVLYALGRYESNSAVIGRRLLDQVSTNLAPVTLEDAAIIEGLRPILALLGRDLNATLSGAAALGDLINRMRTEWDAETFPLESGSFLAVWLALGEGCGTLAAGLLYGGEAVFARGRERLTESANQARILGESFGFWLASQLDQLAQQIWNRSVYQVLGNKGLPDDYVERLASTGIPELWTSQATVIAEGLLDTTAPFVVSLPTGAGKSLIAELCTVQALLDEPGSWGLYLVPTHALVHQVDNDLRRRLPLLQTPITVRTVLAGAEPVVSLNEEVEDLTAPHTITILTPEKLDIYFRNKPLEFGMCRLLIVDEAHKLSDSKRGALLDSLVTRFRVLVPGARVLLLSAVLSNAEEIAPWLDAEARAATSDWRPTRQLKGLAVRVDQPAVNRTVRSAKSSRSERQIAYHGGIVLIHRARDLELTGRIDLPNLFEGVERSWMGKKGRETKQPTGPDHAIDLAVRFAHLSGTTVLFLNSKVSAERCARSISSKLSEYPPDPRLPLSRQLAELLPAGHELIDLTARRIAYHHAGLPTPVRRSIERALANGEIRILCTTPGLQEGVNTPATRVIVVGTTRFASKNQPAEPISVADFANIAGRAGRAGRDTEGMVILLPSPATRWPRARQVGSYYFFPPRDALKVESALIALENELNRVGDMETVSSLTPATQTMLLALHAAGLVAEEELERFFRHTLATHQTKSDAARLAHSATQYLANMSEQHGSARLTRYAQTALALESCIQLDTALRNLWVGGYAITTPLTLDDRISPERLVPLLSAILEVTQLQEAPFTSAAIAEDTAQILSAWMNGASYADIAAALPRQGNKEVNTLEYAVSYLSVAGNQLAWGLGAAYLLLDLLAPDEVHPDFGLLPLYVKFGVNTASAAYASLLGISDRVAATTLAAAYQNETGLGATILEPFAAVERWIRNLTPTRVRNLPISEGRAQTVLADLGLTEEVTGSSIRTRSRQWIRLDRDAIKQPLIGEFCEVRADSRRPGGMVVLGRLTGETWGTLVNTDTFATFVGAGNPNFMDIFGVALRRPVQQRADLLEIQFWRKSP